MRFGAHDGTRLNPMTMPRSTPAAEGVDGRGLLALLDAFETPGHGFHSIMIARHGKVIAEGWWAPYDRDRVHLAYSLSKSFTATVLGELAGRGLIALDAPVWSYLADLDTIPEKWRRVTVRHCITMTVGHTEDAWDWRGDSEPTPRVLESDDELLPLILDREPDGEPGEVWAYNQVGTYLVAQAIAAATGEPVTAHVRRLLDRFGGAAAKAQRTHQGRDLGFSGMCLTTPSILALAQTWLDGGVWEGEWVVPTGFAPVAPQPTAASLASTDVGDWSRGYGHSFWGQRHGYRGDGAFGQFAVVGPEQDVAVAITSEVENMQEVLDLLWEHLIPAIDAETDPGADAELARRLADLAHRPLSGDERRPPLTLPRDESSQLPAEFTSATLVPTESGHVLLLHQPSGPLTTRVGDGEWLESQWPTPRGPEVSVAASGAWQGDVFTAELRLVETPHTILVELDPETGAARLNWRLEPLTGPSPLSTAALAF